MLGYPVCYTGFMKGSRDMLGYPVGNMEVTEMSWAKLGCPERDLYVPEGYMNATEGSWAKLWYLTVMNKKLLKSYDNFVEFTNLAKTR
jgi:hypothetical protein